MFSCTTKFSCDICGTTFVSTGNRMCDCISKDWFRIRQKRDGWKTVYGKYDVCAACIKHYGMKYIRNRFKENKNNGNT